MMGSPPSPEQKGTPCRVLAVDDDLLVLRAITLVMEMWGYQVIPAASVYEAVEQVSRKGRPGAMVVDYRLRDGETGLMVIESIRQMYGDDIPALVITGDTAPDKVREIVASGVHVMHKPVDPERLKRHLKMLRKKNFNIN